MIVGKIYTISDLHVDYQDNMQWVEDLSDEIYKNDTIIIPGDISNDINKLIRTLKLCRRKFKDVYFCPGNHELWTAGQKEDEKLGIRNSVEKFHYILRICDKIGVRTKPGVTDQGVVILPLFAWYDESLYIEIPDSITDPNIWSDTHRCQWPKNVTQKTASKYFVECNQKNIDDVIDKYRNLPIITFSHFFTSKKLMHAYNDLTKSNESAQANFSLVAGTQLLNEQLEQIKPKVHIFGHSHRKMVLNIGDGIKYINNPLGYESERKNGSIEGPYDLMEISLNEL